MNYRIQITKTEPNPNYLEERKEYDRPRYAYERETRMEPMPEFVKNALSVELTEEQFKKVKAEVMKVFE